MDIDMSSKKSDEPSFEALQRAHEAITRRLRKAFPEMTLCVAHLIGASEAGAKWDALIDTYARALGRQRALTLHGEIHDLRSISNTRQDGLDLDTFMTVLGWDLAEAPDEAATSITLLGQLDETIDAVWEADPTHA